MSYVGRGAGESMRRDSGYGFYFAQGGIHCPLCGARMPRGSFFCGHCRRSGRLHLDESDVRAASREIRLPRGILRNGLRRSA